MDVLEYTDKVHAELESLHYPEMVQEFSCQDVALSMGLSIISFYALGISYRMCALTIYGLTMEYQIMPQAARMVKH